MIYVFLSSVCLTLFLVVGFIALYQFLNLMQRSIPLSWMFYSHAAVLTLAAALFFALACVFGSLIPQCYV